MKKIIGVLLLAILVTAALAGCADVSQPEIKSAEFDFSVTYEYMGEEKTVSGVYVCEFAGIGWANDIGYYREWRGYVKDGKTTETIVLGVAKDGGIVELDLGLIPDYLMGEQCAEGAHFAPYISVKLSDDEGVWFENDEGVIEATYGAKILSYECDEPLENNIGPSR